MAIVALKCGKKRPLYSENEESAVHSWRASEWRKNAREEEEEEEEKEEKERENERKI